MFADSLLDSAWSGRSLRPWATLISFALQAIAVSCLLLLPLLYVQGLPKLALLAPLLAPAPAPPPALQTSPARPATSSPAQSNMMGLRLLAPGEIPRAVNMLTETAPPPPLVDPSALGINHGTGDPGGRGTVMDAMMGSRLVIPPPPPIAHKPPISRMMEGNLIQRVEPRYPPLAIQARIQGRVLLRAVISRAGLIEHLQLVSGHPLLAQAAIDAVSRWRYRPYLLNGEPVEVETEVTVDFHFAND
jgi:protein TonB